MKNTFGYLLFLGLAVMVGCQQPESTLAKSPSALLKLNLQGEPRSLDPRKGDRRSQVVLRMLFDGLTRINRDNSLELALADHIELSDDQLVYTFHLKEAHLVGWLTHLCS